MNHENQKVGSVDVRDEVFGGRVNADLIWESVVHANAAERRGTHATKNRALVSGSGKKPWRQKGTGRARVGSSRTPLWRHGGTVFGPQPRSYDFKLPKKVELGALRAALAEKMKAGDAGGRGRAHRARDQDEGGRRNCCGGSASSGRPSWWTWRSTRSCRGRVRNIPGVSLVQSTRLTAREVIDAGRVVATKSALEKLQEALGVKLTDVIRRPLITEKTSILREDGRTIVFQVARDANKTQIKRAIRAAARLEGRERPDQHRARQGEAAGSLRRTTIGLEEGLREAARRRKDA